MEKNKINFANELHQNGYLTNWNIGTSTDGYFEKFISWASNNELVQKMLQKDNFNIRILKKTEQYSIALFDVDDNVTVYSSNGKKNRYSEATYSQCFRVLDYLGFGEYNKNNKIFVFNKDKLLELNRINEINQKNYTVVKWISESLQEIAQDYNDKISIFSSNNQIELKPISGSPKFTVYISFLKDYILEQINNNKNQDEDNNFDYLAYSTIANSIKKKRNSNTKTNLEQYFYTKKFANTINKLINTNSDEITTAQSTMAKKLIQNFNESVEFLKKIIYVTTNEIYDVVYEPFDKNIEKYHNDKQKWLTYFQDSKNWAKNVNSSVISIKELFNSIVGIEGDDHNNGIIYQIPIFQREYKWPLTLVFSLLENIASNVNGFVFLNTIILTEKRDFNSNTKCYNVVDGQQRIFSLILISLAIIKYKFSQNLPIDNNMLNLMQKSNNEYKIEKYFKNVENRSDYQILIDFIKSKRNNIDLNSQQNKIDNYLIKIVEYIHNNTIKNKNYIENLEQNLLYHTGINRVILSNVDENDVFLNLNKNSLPLNALDLFKSYLYSIAIDKCKLEGENEIKNFINPLLKEFKIFYTEKKDNQSLLYEFSSKLFFHLIGYESAKKTKNDANIYLNLKNSLDHLIEKEAANKDEINRDVIQAVFDEMIELIHQWQFINSGKNQTNCKYSFKHGKNFNDSYLWHAIYGATYGFSLNIPVNIIWKLLEKYYQKGVFNKNNFKGEELKQKYKLVNELMQYLKELERAIVLWKIITFKGDSQTKKAFKIASKIENNENSYKSIEEFIDDLEVKIINSNIRLSDNQIKTCFIKKIDDQDFTQEYDALSEKLKDNNTRAFYCMRYHFISQISKNIDLLKDPTTNISINGVNNFDINLSHIHYDHDMPVKLESQFKEILIKQHKFSDENYLQKVQLIGNGKLLYSTKNKSKSNYVPRLSDIDKNKSSYSSRKFLIINDYIDEFDQWEQVVMKESLEMCKTLYKYYTNKLDKDIFGEHYQKKQ
ncbi:DUF262 domain-containing protein [Mycoplasmopsis phocirhinis]|uniref:DUF262 domain-containing protein n=1 Tax=Mycoplasmopsis phocirhinis TaxID=142650 RepID=A0A4P6MM29_9BACT|nr:DUF262 domain-containing protein [Mycoplasmopsis phocirhinis]QBF34528.1 DUF262 domain-containing protein [Mycoplasmopsis phocirhinis]